MDKRKTFRRKIDGIIYELVNAEVYKLSPAETIRLYTDYLEDVHMKRPKEHRSYSGDRRRFPDEQYTMRSVIVTQALRVVDITDRMFMKTRRGEHV